MNHSLSIPERCARSLTQWKSDLGLNNRENDEFKSQSHNLDEQIKRCGDKHLRITVLGRTGVGKSSLLNAIIQEKVFPTGLSHGNTKRMQIAIWDEPIERLTSIELVDTPGIDEVNPRKKNHLTKRFTTQADLVLLVIDSDLTQIDLEILQELQSNGKPVFLILNRCDQWKSDEIKELITSIKNRLPTHAKNIQIKAVTSAPRQSKIAANGKIRSERCSANVEILRKSLITLLNEQGELLLSLNTLRQADIFYKLIRSERLKRGKSNAQSLIGKFAVLKASGVAANPLLMLDLTTALACDTALVLQLSKLYGLQLKGSAARALLKRLSVYSVYLGGAQISIQLVLSILRQLLLMAAPFTGGLSLAPAAPVALAQAALAVHTTKLTGKLAARELLKGVHRSGIQPSSILHRLANQNPEIKSCLNHWQSPTERIAPFNSGIHSILP